MMQMHGEKMMRAMGDILIKYADKLEPSVSTTINHGVALLMDNVPQLRLYFCAL